MLIEYRRNVKKIYGVFLEAAHRASTSNKAWFVQSDFQSNMAALAKALRLGHTWPLCSVIS